jgi:hypothetical protein
VSLGQETGLGKVQFLARAVETPSFAAHAQGWLHAVIPLLSGMKRSEARTP